VYHIGPITCPRYLNWDTQLIFRNAFLRKFLSMLKSLWHHRAADNFNIHQANYHYMRIGWLNMLVEFRFEIPSDCWENCKKSQEILFCCTPCTMPLLTVACNELPTRWRYTPRWVDIAIRPPCMGKHPLRCSPKIYSICTKMLHNFDTNSVLVVSEGFVVWNNDKLLTLNARTAEKWCYADCLTLRYVHLLDI